MSTPDSFGSTLLYTIVSAGQLELSLSSVTEVFDKLKAAPGSPVGSVLNTFYQALQQTFKGRPRPAIIIDEANKLMSWSTTHPEELRTLLSFFVAITKEQNVTHVLLVTSDYAFVSWLEEGEHIVFPGPHGCRQVVPSSGI